MNGHDAARRTGTRDRRSRVIVAAALLSLLLDVAPIGRADAAGASPGWSGTIAIRATETAATDTSTYSFDFQTLIVFDKTISAYEETPAPSRLWRQPYKWTARLEGHTYDSDVHFCNCITRRVDEVGEGSGDGEADYRLQIGPKYEDGTMSLMIGTPYDPSVNPPSFTVTRTTAETGGSFGPWTDTDSYARTIMFWGDTWPEPGATLQTDTMAGTRTSQNGGMTITVNFKLTTRADGDHDGIPDDEDTCPSDFNPDQDPAACGGGGSTDGDGDGVPDPQDNCLAVPNPLQEDTDHDGLGDSCDPEPLVPQPKPKDSDEDGFSDDVEEVYGSDAHDGAVTPVVPTGEIDNKMAISGELPEVSCGVLPSGIDTCSLQPGDIVLWHSSGKNAAFETWATTTYWSHSLLVVGRWRMESLGPQHDGDHIRVFLADVTPDRTPAEAGMVEASATELKEGPDLEGAPVAVRVIRPSTSRANRSISARIALVKMLNGGAANIANQHESGWWAPDLHYTYLPDRFGPTEYYCSSFIAWAYRNVKAISTYQLISPWLIPDNLFELGTSVVAGYGPDGGGVTMHSPAHVLLTSPTGTRSGWLADGTLVDEVPGAAHYVTVDSEGVAVPGFGADWEVTVAGYDTGAYHVDSHSVGTSGISDDVFLAGSTRPGAVENYQVSSLPSLVGRPVALDDTAAVTLGSTVDIDVAANDLDAVGMPLEVLDSPAHGTVSTVVGTVGPILRYSPAAFLGTDTLAYQVCDADHRCSAAQVTVRVGAASLVLTKPASRKGPAKATAGRTLDVAFTIGGNGGIGVLAEGSPSTGPATCLGASMGPPVTATATRALTYDPRRGSYSMAIATNAAWKGTCRLVSVELADGSRAATVVKFG